MGSPCSSYVLCSQCTNGTLTERTCQWCQADATLAGGTCRELTSTPCASAHTLVTAACPTAAPTPAVTRLVIFVCHSGRNVFLRVASSPIADTSANTFADAHSHNNDNDNDNNCSKHDGGGDDDSNRHNDIN
jgi:hypothetical protein